MPSVDLPNDLAHDWFGLGTWILIVAAVVYVVRALVQIRNQVKNSHDTNMRDDLDDQSTLLAKIWESQQRLHRKHAKNARQINRLERRMARHEKDSRSRDKQ